VLVSCPSSLRDGLLSPQNPNMLARRDSHCHAPEQLSRTERCQLLRKLAGPFSQSQPKAHTHALVSSASQLAAVQPSPSLKLWQLCTGGSRPRGCQR
jgi:hypothetical protein